MLQDIDQVSLIQRYPLGFRLQDGDRVYRYARAGAALNTDVGAKNPLGGWIVEYCPVNAAASGAKVVVITCHNTDGVLDDGNIAADELAGGFINIYTHEIYHPPPVNIPWTINRMIVHNTAISPASLVMTVTLDKPLGVALTGGNTMHAECICSPYRSVISGWPAPIANIEKMSVVGYPTRYADVLEYLWLQTWGPLEAAILGGLSNVDNLRELAFTSAGMLQLWQVALPGSQRAGYVLNNTANPGASYIFLQLAP
jgi:hypothetical protein